MKNNFSQIITHMKKFAFTLAEALITITIIGVVAALTIPNLVQNHKEKITVNKVKKVYSVLSQAILMNAANEGITKNDIRVNELSEGKFLLAKLFLPYLQVIDDCGATKDACGFGTIYYRNGNRYTTFGPRGLLAYSVTLKDSSTITFYVDSNHWIYIFYDINGRKDPNKLGIDVFLFNIDENNQIGFFGTFETGCAKKTQSGLSCSVWIIRYDNMEYLKCDDLQINGPRTKCEN